MLDRNRILYATTLKRTIERDDMALDNAVASQVAASLRLEGVSVTASEVLEASRFELIAKRVASVS